MTVTATPRQPITFLSRSIAMLARLMPRADGPPPEDARAANPRILEQDLSVVLLPRSETSPETAETYTLCLRAYDNQMGPLFTPADVALTEALRSVKERAGRYGLTINDRFYPHSRIDYVEEGAIRVVAPGIVDE